MSPNYAIEKERKRYINELIVDTENVIRQLDPKLQTAYRHLAAKQIKHITTTNRHNILHKTQKYSTNQLKNILKDNNLTIVKADKTKAIVIINKEKLKIKVNKLTIESHMEQLTKTPRKHFKNKFMKQSKNAIG